MRHQPEDPPAELADAFARARDRFGRLGAPLLFFSTVGSTNDVATALAQSGGQEGAVIVADAQTAGRGRRGRTWFSPPGAGLYVSIVLNPGRAAASDRASALVTLAAGVALAEGVQHVAGLAPDIKWPNDLVIGRRKLAGILAEGVTGDAPHGVARVTTVILGYGVNVRPTAYPPELAERATSLESELGRPIDRAALCAETIVALGRRYDDLLAGRFDAILDAWRSRAPASHGARIAWTTPGGPKSGVTAGIDETGALLVRVGGSQIERLVAGEVNWI
jgi:BirA family biotin operon repressor/biotin-[acetyl-CoA-carboxylase] ligase